MSDAEFIGIFKKSIVKQCITGMLLLAFGFFIVWLIFSGSNSTINKFGIIGWIILWTLSAICLISGIVGIFIPLKNILLLRNGKHLLINAIEQNDTTYLIWFYEYAIHSRGKLSSDKQLWAFGRDGKRYTLAVKKSRIEPLTLYLKSKFPAAKVGFNKEMQAQIDEIIKANRTNN